MRFQLRRTGPVGAGFVLALLLLSSTAAVAPAAPLAGTVLTNPGDTVFAGLIPPGLPAGTLLASMVSPWSFAVPGLGLSSGTLSSAVFMNLTGTLDFYYQIANDSTSVSGIARETNVNFAGFATWTGYRVDGAALPGGVFADGTVPPVTVSRDFSGAVVGFNFQPPAASNVLPGQISNVLVISTDATLYTIGSASIIDGGVASVAAFQPAGAPPPIPEPGTIGLLGTGLLAGVLWRRRRRA